MRFETSPTLVLTQEEGETLDQALKLCRDMDRETGACGCSYCPRSGECSGRVSECVFAIAHKTLKVILDMAVIK